MTQSKLLELAKQGDPQAIASLMNQTLQPRGITATTDLHDQCLEVVLESTQVPNRQVLATFVQKGLTTLGIHSIQSVKIFGKQTGSNIPVWEQELDMTIPEMPIPNEYALRGAQKDIRVVPNPSTIEYPPETSGDNGSTAAIAEPAMPELPLSEAAPSESNLVDEFDDFDESDPILAGTHSLIYPDQPLLEDDEVEGETVADLEDETFDEDFSERQLIGTYALDNPDDPLDEDLNNEFDDEAGDDFAVDADYVLPPPADALDAPLFPPTQSSLADDEENYLLGERSTEPLSETLFSDTDRPDETNVAVINTNDMYGAPYEADLDDELFSSSEPVEPFVNSSPIVDTPPASEARVLEDNSALAPVAPPPPTPPIDEEEFQPTDRNDEDERNIEDHEDDREAAEPNIPWGALVLGFVLVWIIGLIGVTLWAALMRPSPQPAPLFDPTATPPVPPSPQGGVPASPGAAAVTPAPTASPLAQGSPSPQTTPILRSSPSPQVTATSQPNPVGSLTPPAIACTPAPAGATPITLSTLRFDSRPDADGDYVVGCITNRSNQAIASVTFSFLGRSTRDASIIQSGSSEVIFNNLQPGQAVPFISAFTINPAVNNLRIQSISWVPAGANQSQQAQTTLTLTR
jgi:hypothetical protein